MLPTPRTGGLLVAVLVAFVGVGLGSYLQFDDRTPLAIQAVLYFFATLVVFHRFRLFRRP